MLFVGDEILTVGGWLVIDSLSTFTATGFEKVLFCWLSVAFAVSVYVP